MGELLENLKWLNDDSLITDQIGLSLEKADERGSESSCDSGPRVTPVPSSMTRSAE